eukprot:4876783-Pyramimonas_sp.AAC.1
MQRSTALVSWRPIQHQAPLKNRTSKFVRIIYVFVPIQRVSPSRSPSPRPRASGPTRLANGSWRRGIAAHAVLPARGSFARA